MTVAIRRKQGEALVVRFRDAAGNTADAVVYVRKISPSRVNLYISPVSSEGSGMQVEVHRIEHLQGEEFDRALEYVEEESHKKLNTYNQKRYNGLPVAIICTPSYSPDEGTEEIV